MLKQTRASYFSNFKNAQYCALSSDPIPDYVKNGDEVYIIDTAKRCLYDADSGTLIEQPSSGGGGSSDWTNASVTFINNTPENGEYFVDTPFGVIPIEEQETIVLPLKKEDGSIFYLSLKDIVDVESSVAPSVTGDITIEESGFEIQGDGSIAFSSLAPTEISGVPPLELDDALARPLRKLVQHGKVDVSGTDITCNNGTLKFGALGKNLFDQSQLLQATDWTFDNETGYYYGSRSAFNIAFGNGFPALPEFKENTQYSISLSAYNSSEVSATYLRFHYTDESQTNILISGTTPQAITATSTSGKTVAKISGTFGSEGAVMTYIKDFMLVEGATPLPYEPYIEGIYVDGTPEEIRLNGINQWDEEWELGGIGSNGAPYSSDTSIRSKNFCPCLESTPYYIYGTVGIYFYDSDKTFIEVQYGGDTVKTSPSNAAFFRLGFFTNYGTTYNNDTSVNYPSTDTDYHPAHIQTATAENLFAVDDIEDTQDIVTGEVIHRTEAVVSDGTTPSGRYVGTVGEGNVIVRVREDKYEGEVVSFEAEEEFPLNKLVVNMSPKQDLHGYDSPWPEGGGKNKFNQTHFSDPTVYANTYSGYTYSDVLHLKPNTKYTFAPDSSASVGTGQYYYLYVVQGSDPEAMSGSGIYPVYNGAVTGSNVVNTFTTGETGAIRFGVPNGGINAKIAAVMTPNWQLEEGETATAWSPYSNVCPISGWTGCEVYVDGKNWFDKSNFTLLNNVYLDNNTGEVKSGNGNKTLVIPATAGEFTLSVSGLNISGRFGAFSDMPEVGDIPLSVVNIVSSEKKGTLTAPSSTKFFAFTYNNTAVTQTYSEQEILDSIQIELGSTATAYEPYTGDSYSVTFGETVYGATPDIVSGEMPIDTGLFILDGSSDEYMAGSGNRITNTALRGLIATPTSASSVVSGNIANWLPQATGNQTYVGKLGFSIDPNGDLEISDGSGAMTVSGLRTMLSENPLVLALKRATPIQTTITPTPITALKGYNAMWSDGGAVAAYVSEGDLVEQVTPQPLITAKGDNTLIVTAEVDDIVFDVAYRKDNSGGETLPDARGVYF